MFGKWPERSDIAVPSHRMRIKFEVLYICPLNIRIGRTDGRMHTHTHTNIDSQQSDSKWNEPCNNHIYHAHIFIYWQSIYRIVWWLMNHCNDIDSILHLWMGFLCGCEFWNVIRSAIVHTHIHTHTRAILNVYSRVCICSVTFDPFFLIILVINR